MNRMMIMFLIIAAVVAVVFMLPKASLYYLSTTIPCTYAGCENDVQCLAGYTKSGCTVPGVCTCIRGAECTDSSDCTGYGNICGLGRQTSWTCVDAQIGGQLTKGCNYECFNVPGPPVETHWYDFILNFFNKIRSWLS